MLQVLETQADWRAKNGIFGYDGNTQKLPQLSGQNSAA